MSVFKKGLYGLKIVDAFNAKLRTAYEKGAGAYIGTDPSVDGLMTGSGSKAFLVATILFDLPQRNITQANFRAYLTEWVGLSLSEAEHIIEVYFENKQGPGYIVSSVVRAELHLIEAYDTATNLSKYLRGFETARLISRVKTGRGTEIAYRLTEHGIEFIETIEALEKEIIDA